MAAHLPNDVHFIACGPGGGAALPAEVVGNKAANLMRMARAGLPVPPGFVLSTAMCRQYFRDGQRLPPDFRDGLAAATHVLEAATGLTLGGERRPLLLAVRSGAATSMPGMMDTVLNVGLTDRALGAMVRMTGNPRHAWDSYRRLVQAYGEVVAGAPADLFDRLLDEALAAADLKSVAEMGVSELRDLTRAYLAACESRLRTPFPQPLDQLSGAVEAVFRSWHSPRAVEFRRLHGLADDAGTAVTVQAMVFGNMGGTSGSGVAFSRNPATGAGELYLDYLPNAQGEDVVSGRCAVQGSDGVLRALPELFGELRRVGGQLELLFRDAQDFEFTVQEGRLYLLQARNAKRTPRAALRIAVELVREGVIGPGEALAQMAGVDPAALHERRLAAHEAPPLAQGIPASPGVAVGAIALGPEEAMKQAAVGRPTVLVRPDVLTTDVSGMAAAVGILTARGGRTSHGAVVARQLDKVCVVGCRDLAFDPNRKACRLGDRWFTEGEYLSLDGHTGHVYPGKLEVVVDRPTEYLAEVERWRRESPEVASPPPLANAAVATA